MGFHNTRVKHPPLTRITTVKKIIRSYKHLEVAPDTNLGIDRMRKYLFVALFALATLSSTAMVSQPENINGVERVDNREQASLRFYEQLLEQFCLTHFKECFNATYKENSLTGLTITKKSSDGSVVYIKGRQSFSGRFMNHNDKDFEAKITHKGGNRYEIWFKKRVIYAARPDSWESATRTITFSR